MRAQPNAVAHRFVQVQVWWIVAQLVARNPDLSLHEQVDLVDGQALVLSLPESSVIPLEVRSRLRVVFDSEGVKLVAPVVFQTLTWAEVFAFSDPLEAVRRIENSIGLTPTESSASALSSRSLTYTIIALLLAGRVNCNNLWQVRSVVPELLGVDEWGLTDLSSFPILEEHVLAHFELDVLHGVQPIVPPAWVIYEEVEPVAAFDEFGGFHCQEMCFKLRDIYENTGCSIHATTMMVASTIRG